MGEYFVQGYGITMRISCEFGVKIWVRIGLCIYLGFGCVLVCGDLGAYWIGLWRFGCILVCGDLGEYWFVEIWVSIGLWRFG